MSAQFNLNCSTCGKPVDKSGSMTQWIFAKTKCSCKGEEKVVRELVLCPICGLRTAGRDGTLTGWIFRSKHCSCIVSDGFDRSSDVSNLPNGLKLKESSYEWLSVAGHGGMATVYKAKDKKLDRFVAIKIMHKDVNDDDGSKKNFLREAKAASRLTHPNIVDIADFGLLEDGRQYLVIEWIDGITLHEYISRHGPLLPETAIEIFIQILDGLSHAHNKGVIHRDIKPSNIMLGRTISGGWIVKIIDFGTAKDLSHDGSITRAEDLACSPFYVSPERVSGLLVDNRSDLYSLGCTLFESLVGHPPFTGQALSVVMMHLEESPPSLCAASPGIRFPEQLELFVAKLLAKRPDERFQNAEDAKRALIERNIDRMPAITSQYNDLPLDSAEDSDRLFPSKRLALKWQLLAFGFLGLAVCWLFAIKVNNNQNDNATNKKMPTAKKQKLKFNDPILSLDAGLISIRGQSVEISGPTKKEFAKLKTLVRVKDLTIANSENLPPKLLGSLSCKNNLTRLNMVSSSLKNTTALSGLSEYPNLETIRFTSCIVDGKSLAFLKDIPSLTKLSLRFNSLGDDVLPEINKIRTLTSLNLDGTDTSDSDLKKLDKLDKLVYIELSNNKLSGEGFKSLVCKNNLKHIVLKNVPVTAYGLSSLKEFTKIDTINFSNNHITEKHVQALKQIPGLVALIFAHSKIDQSAYAELGSLHRIKQLGLSDTNTSDDELLQLTNLKGLTYLNLKGTRVTPKGLKSLRAHIKSLGGVETPWGIDRR